MPQPRIEISAIIARASARADMVGSDLWSSAELIDLAEASFQKFYLQAVSKYEDYFLFTTGTAVVRGATQFTLDVTTLKFRGVRHTNGSKEFLRKIDLHEVPLATSSGEGRPKCYSVRLSPTALAPYVDIYPTADATYAFDVHTIPIYSLRDINSGAGAQTSLRYLAGWDQYIVLDMAIAMKDREESDCSVLMAERADWSQLMEKSMASFDLGEPPAVVQRAGRIQDPYADPFSEVF